MNDLLLVADNQQLAFMVFLDLSAAFDTLNHRMLLLQPDDICNITLDVKSAFVGVVQRLASQ